MWLFDKGYHANEYMLTVVTRHHIEIIMTCKVSGDCRKIKHWQGWPWRRCSFLVLIGHLFELFIPLESPTLICVALVLACWLWWLDFKVYLYFKWLGDCRRINSSGGWPMRTTWLSLLHGLPCEELIPLQSPTPTRLARIFLMLSPWS